MVHLVLLAPEKRHARKEKRTHRLASTCDGDVQLRSVVLGVFAQFAEHEVRRAEIVATCSQIVYLVPLYIWYGANRRFAKYQLPLDVDSFAGKALQHVRPDAVIK